MNNGGYGPNGKDKWILRQSVIEFMNECTEYMYHASVWSKFVVWRYTIGSGALNRHLIGIKNDPNLRFWVYLTCKWWYGLLLTEKYKDAQIEAPMDKYEWKIWLSFKPDEVLKLDNNDPRLGAFLDDFAICLRNVILGTPEVKEEFKVVKVSTKYPELPDPSNFRPVSVPQKPFNSTTLDLELNFGFFLADDTENFIFVLTIPKGSHVLYIPPTITAYPWEQEVLLPFGCSFNMERLSSDVLQYYHKQQPFIRQIQKEPLTIGPIWFVDDGIQTRKLISKQMKVMEGYYVSPTVKIPNKMKLVSKSVLTLKELREIAKKKGIKGYSKMKKSELSALI